MTDELMAQFLIEGRELVASAERDLAALARRPDDAGALDGCFRAIHTLKGSAGLFDLAPMGLMLHAAEDLLAPARPSGPGRPRTSKAWSASWTRSIAGWTPWIDGRLPPTQAVGAESARLRGPSRFGERTKEVAPGPRRRLATARRVRGQGRRWPSAIRRAPTAISRATTRSPSSRRRRAWR
jgi:HPt (histidine-containing phosphotransfer) domain-containing protein